MNVYLILSVQITMQVYYSFIGCGVHVWFVGYVIFKSKMSKSPMPITCRDFDKKNDVQLFVLQKLSASTEVEKF